MELLEEVGSGEEGSGEGRGEVAVARSGDLEAIERGRRRLPDCGLCFQERVPERPRAAALVAGFLGSVSSRVTGGSMVGVGVCAAFSCSVRGLSAAERGVEGEGLSGEMDRARSAHKDISLIHCNWEGKPRAERTRSAGQSLAAALQQLLLKLLHPLGILLVSLLTERPDALHELGGVNVLRHGCGQDSGGPGGRLRSWSWCWAKEVWMW